MDESLTSMDLDRSRLRRTTTLLISSPQIFPSPTINHRYVRLSRKRTRPRHFDSSPDLDVPQGCEKTVHFPSKTLRDFIDSQGRQHAKSPKTSATDPTIVAEHISSTAIAGCNESVCE